MLGQKVSIGVPLTVRHQEQHPHKAYIGCRQNILHQHLKPYYIAPYVVMCQSGSTTKNLLYEGKDFLLFNHVVPHPLDVGGRWWLIETACAVSSCCAYRIRIIWERNIVLICFVCSHKTVQQQWKTYLCFLDSHLSEALHTPPGQLSSEQEQRKQQSQEPVMEDFQTSIPEDIMIDVL